MRIECVKRRRHSISLTPLIDVVFILLVFFMLATSFTDWRPITLATGTRSAADASKPAAVIHVAVDGTLRYDDHSFGVRRLAARLFAAQHRGEISAIIVAPDDDTPLTATVDAIDALSGAGLNALSLATGQTP